MSETEQLDHILREQTPRVLGALTRRWGDFDGAEDALQEALLAAAKQWPREGVPASPGAWLITVASRRLVELWRNETARHRREELASSLASREPEPADDGDDDTVTVLMLCCHPALTPVSQIALTLRAVGGLTTAEIARALFVPEATVGQRISRAKSQIAAAGGRFEMPPPDHRRRRLDSVLHVLYLIFSEGYNASSGPSLLRVELGTEAIRILRQLHDRAPDDGEVAGLLALMLLTHARRAARTTPGGDLVSLAEQDRRLWDHAAIAEGVELVTTALTHAQPGPYQLQAAIAACHDEAPGVEETDWRQILTLYDLLGTLAPGPMVTLNRIVALAMAHSPREALQELDRAGQDPRLAAHHRLEAVRAHLLELSGQHQAAGSCYIAAAQRTLSIPEQRYLNARAARLQTPIS